MDDTAFRIDEFLPYLLSRAAEAESLRFAHAYKDQHGLLRADWRTLFHLGTGGELAARDIVARTGEDKTQVSRAVARLEARGYLTRRRDPEDRRRERLALTPEGRAVFEVLMTAAAGHDAEIAGRIGDADLARLKEILGRLIGL